MEKEIVNQVQEAQTVPYSIKPRRNTPRHTLIKLTKILEKNSTSINEKATKNIQKNHHNQSNFQQKLCRPEGSSKIKGQKGKTYKKKVL